jgi:hydroxyethylthiazole kinase-like uncharacterized protein yjeF
MSTEIVVTPQLLGNWPLPSADGSKYERGEVVVVGGSPSTPGAVILAGEAALRVGTGRVRLAVDPSLALGVGTAFPESAVMTLHGEHDEYERVDAVLIGPGLDDPSTTARVIDEVIPQLSKTATVILDAFALGVVDRLRTLDRVAGRLILTPNRKEAQLLQRGGDVLRIAQRYEAVVTCFGSIAEPSGKRWKVELSSPGIGTAGSGDVLAGAIAGLCARGATATQATVWGTYLHMRAGQLAGDVGYLARDLVAALPSALEGEIRASS